jgi:hypothetical protein
MTAILLGAIIRKQNRIEAIRTTKGKAVGRVCTSLLLLAPPSVPFHFFFYSHALSRAGTLLMKIWKSKQRNANKESSSRPCATHAQEGTE